MLKGKTVLLGVTGSIAAYKIANLASALMKLHAEVHVIMTKNATNFINPITFETVTAMPSLLRTSSAFSVLSTISLRMAKSEVSATENARMSTFALARAFVIFMRRPGLFSTKSES